VPSAQALFDKPDPAGRSVFEETNLRHASRLARRHSRNRRMRAGGRPRARLGKDRSTPRSVTTTARDRRSSSCRAVPSVGGASGAWRFESGETGNGRRDTSLEESHHIRTRAWQWRATDLEREHQPSGVIMIPVPGAGRVAGGARSRRGPGRAARRGSVVIKRCIRPECRALARRLALHRVHLCAGETSEADGSGRLRAAHSRDSNF